MINRGTDASTAYERRSGGCASIGWLLPRSLSLIPEFATLCLTQEGATTPPSAASQVLELKGKRGPVIVITANVLTREDRRRSNGGVERIIQNGATGPHEVLELVRSITQVLGVKTGTGGC